MARNDQKTNSANSSRDSDESEIEEREGTLGNEEVADGEPIDGTQDASTNAGLGAPSWGFEEKKKRFSKEIVIAFLAIMLLVSAFGFFVWHKFKSPAGTSGLAVIPAPETPPTEEPPKETDDPFTETGTTEPSASLPARVVSTARLPEQREPDVDAMLDQNRFAANNRKPEAPTGLLDQVADPSEFRQPEFPVDAPIGSSEPVMSEPAFPAIASNETLSKTKTQPAVSQPAESEMTDLFEKPRSAPAPVIRPEFSSQEPEPRQFSEPTRPRLAEPAPFEPQPNSLEPMPSQHGFYTVQEGDTFWDISKKLYGKHGYFLALYDHNRDEIPNADLMRPGTKLRTPDTEFLKALATKLAAMSKPVRMAARSSEDDAVQSATMGTSGRRNFADEAGIYVTEKGLPMYRVGERDTLIKIAVDHLGRAERWKQIYNMNRDQLKSEQDLQPGAELRLPADASRVPLASNSHSGR